MPRSSRFPVGVLIALHLATVISAQDRQYEGPIEPFLGEPTLQLQPLFRGERFPNIAVAVDGTVLATWGSSAVRMRRSQDGG